MGRKTSHIPIRSCVICRARKPKRELWRVFIDSDGTLSADVKGNIGGRGAYICRNKACGEKLILSKKLDSIFRVKVKALGQIPGLES